MRLQDILQLGQSVLTLSPSSSDGHAPQGVRSLFSFGDSYTTTSFNVSSTQPSPENPMGNPPLGSGTAADSTNWVGYLATVYNDTTVLSYNHAVYGATVNNTLVPNVPHDLVHQVSRVFEPNYCPSPEPDTEIEPREKWTPEAALFTVWVGINDIYFLSQKTDPLKHIPSVLQSYFNLVDRLHGCGARDFVIFNVPPCDRSPQILTLEPPDIQLYDTVTKEFNRQLLNAAGQWRLANPDSAMSTYDAWSFFTEVLDNPQEYGFVDSTCIGASKGCVWWDDFHPVSALHRLLAADVGRFLGWAG
ncbi:GDSL lipase/esterase [Aspergillus recurvatus]